MKKVKMNKIIIMLFFLVSTVILGSSFAYFTDNVNASILAETGGYELRDVSTTEDIKLPESMKPGDEAPFKIKYENSGTLPGKLEVDLSATTLGEYSKEFTDEVIILHNGEVILNEPNKSIHKIMLEKLNPGEIGELNLILKLKNSGNLELKDLQTLEIKAISNLTGIGNNWYSESATTRIGTKYGGFAHDVHFNSDGGSAVQSQIVEHTGKTSIPSNPTRNGYTFTNWSPDINSVITEGVTFKANWTINKYSIIFNTDGGSAIPNITQDYGSVITPPSSPSKPGHDFDGWNMTIPTTMPSSNLTIKANWKIQKRTVTFDPNGGVVSPQSIVVDYGNTVNLPIPTRLLYKFEGWFTQISGGTKITSIASLTENQTIYARWKLDTFTLKVKPTGTTSKTQTHKIPLDGVKTVNNIKVISPNGGTATVKNVGNNEITVEITGATTHSRTVQTGGSYTPADSKVIEDTKISYNSDSNPISIPYNSQGYLGNLSKIETTTDTYQTGGVYTPSDSKTATDTRTSYGSNSNPSSVSYSSGGYAGTLSRDRTSTSSYQTGGSYTAADSKYVSGQTSSWYNSGGYSGTLSSYLYSGSYTPSDSKYASTTGYTQRAYYSECDGTKWYYSYVTTEVDTPSGSIYYSSGGYSGYLPENQTRYEYVQNWIYGGQGIYGPSGSCTKGATTRYRVVNTRYYYGGTITRPASDTRTYRYEGTVNRPASDTRTYGTAYTGHYSGTVVKPASDTRTWGTSYTSKYSGTVTRPESDTRTYENYFDYELEIDYTKN